MEEKVSEITLQLLKSKIPEKCFEKSLFRSLSFMIWDLIFLSVCFLSYDFFAPSWIGLLVYWNVTGFAMWCLFVIGHDCGHGSFSDYPLINAICGHICHAPLLVPYYPWAYSHLQHHRFHNHVKKDKSHPWLTHQDLKLFSIAESLYLKSLFAPFTGFIFYLYFGKRDGSHINPMGKLYRNAPRKEKIRCIISLSSLFLYPRNFKSWSRVPR